MKALTLLVSVAWVTTLGGCASTREVRSQDYAQLKQELTFEHELPVVWKGLQSALSKHKIVEMDDEDLKERELETDWIYSRSRDKYVEYKVNGLPKKKYLQTRFRYRVGLKQVMGGTHVTVDLDEQLEQLKEDGSPAGYKRAETPDTSRTNELLEKIRLSIRSAAL